MNKDELILEIIEKVHENVSKLESKVDIIQMEQVRQGELHNFNSKNLEDHMARTAASEDRLAVLEHRDQFIVSVIKVITYGAAIIAFFVKVVPFIANHFHL